jgi:hypothetical protein
LNVQFLLLAIRIVNIVAQNKKKDARDHTKSKTLGRQGVELTLQAGSGAQHPAS